MYLVRDSPKTSGYGSKQSRPKATNTDDQAQSKPRIPLSPKNEKNVSKLASNLVQPLPEPEPEPFPDWLETDQVVSVDEINKFLQDFAPQLKKSHYKQVLAKLRDLLYSKQNEDAITRSKTFKYSQSLAETKKAIQEKTLVLDRLKKNEVRDKEYITLQQKELRTLNKDDIMRAKTLKEKEDQTHQKAQKDSQTFYAYTVDKFEKDFAENETRTFEKMSAKEKEIMALLEKIKKLKSSKAYGQEKLIFDLVKYRDK